MGRRSDHTPDQLRALALEAARAIVEEEGTLTTRAVAKRIGYTVGTLYNVFENVDDLIFHLNAQTIDLFKESLSKASSIQELGERYIRFAQEHPGLWSLLYDYKENRPSWYEEKVESAIALVESRLSPVAKERAREATLVLWSGLHGIIALSRQQKLAPEVLIRSLLDNYLRGLQT